MKCTDLFYFIFMVVWNLVVNFIEYFVFIGPLLGIIFCVFYKDDCEREANSVAHFSICTCICYLIMVE
jgi:hypothetical protein